MKHSLGEGIAQDVIEQKKAIFNQLDALRKKASLLGLSLLSAPSPVQEEQLQKVLLAQDDIHPDVLVMRKNIANLEAKKAVYPMASMTEAAAWMGISDRSNGSKEINKAEKVGALFTVEFFNGKRMVPMFQIDVATKKPYPIIKALLDEITEHGYTPVESWLVYDWFTTPIDDDEQLTPAKLIAQPEAHEELLYLASQAAANMAGRIAL